MSKRAGKCALGPYLRIANFVRRLGQHRRPLVDLVRVLDLAIGGHRADGELAIFTAHVRQARDASEIDQQFRLREPQLHQWQQAMPTGQNFGVRIFEQVERLFQAARRGVCELGREHLRFC